MESQSVSGQGEKHKAGRDQPTHAFVGAARLSLPLLRFAYPLACELGCERISVTANFFDIGASSALLAKCYTRIVEQTGRSFPLISLFRHPTVRSLARNLMKPGDAPPTPGDRRAAKLKQAMQSLKARRTH